jgi:formamidopyrimidine-DNA glycosylase
VPELPEAETIVRGLAGELPGRRIVGVHVRHADVIAPLGPTAFGRALRGGRVQAVGRRAKKVVLMLEEDRLLVVNLGMTGRLVLDSAPGAAQLRHVAVRLDLDDGRSLLYDDVRRFGRLELHDAASWARRSATLGAEPLERDFTAAGLFALTRRSRSPIRNWLLDQRRVAGVGNIYANEALFRARLRPDRPAHSLKRAEVGRLHGALREVLAEAVAGRGTTISDYRDERGEPGEFADRLRVYDRTGEPCRVCGTPIERAVLANRSLFYCPRCQR